MNATTKPPMDKTKGWGKVFIALRYQPQTPSWTTESLMGLAEFGYHNAPDDLVKYVERLETIARATGHSEATANRPERYLAQGDMRDFIYSKTMHKAANMLARKFLATDCDTICFIDTDGVFGTDALEEIRNDPEGWQYDVLQAFTVKRGWPPEPMYLAERHEQPKSDDRLQGESFVTALPLNPDHIYPLGSASLHFTLIRRWVFEALIEKEGPLFTYWFEYSRDNGEDVTFSVNARKAGAKMGMTTRLKVGHVCEAIYGWDVMVEYNYYRVLHESGALPRASVDRLMEFYDAQMQLAELVAEYTGEEAQTVFEKSLEGGWLVRDKWNVEQPTSANEVREFYGNTPQYFYDLIKWNASPSFQKILGGLRGVTGEKVLKIGGGLGTMSEFLAVHGNTVHYYDVPGALRDFATWRFARLNGHAANVQIVERWEIANADEPESGYDRIVAVDILEHIHPDEFEFTLKGLMMALKPGGAFFAHNNWSKQDGSYPQHFDHEAKWNELINQFGLRKVSEFEWRKSK